MERKKTHTHKIKTNSKKINGWEHVPVKELMPRTFLPSLLRMSKHLSSSYGLSFKSSEGSRSHWKHPIFRHLWRGMIMSFPLQLQWVFHCIRVPALHYNGDHELMRKAILFSSARKFQPLASQSCCSGRITRRGIWKERVVEKNCSFMGEEQKRGRDRGWGQTVLFRGISSWRRNFQRSIDGIIEKWEPGEWLGKWLSQ